MFRTVHKETMLEFHALCGQVSVTIKHLLIFSHYKQKKICQQLVAVTCVECITEVDKTEETANDIHGFCTPALGCQLENLNT